MPATDDVVIGSRLFINTLKLLRRPFNVAAAQTQLQERLAHREENVLSLARTAIYGNSRSPYGSLLAAAGCEIGDLEGLVSREGLEGALQDLFRRGVYLSGDEAKGRRAVVRGSVTFEINPRELRKPRAAADLLSHTSGSQGTDGAVPVAIGPLQESGSYDVLEDLGHDLVHATWTPPGSNALRLLIALSLHRAPLRRWFSPVDPASSQLHPRYRWSAAAVRAAGLLNGMWLPGPEYVPFSDPLPIVQWMSETLRRGQRPCLRTFVTPAVRLCQVAHDAGVDLHGAHFWISGEPTTPARLMAIQSVGLPSTRRTAQLSPACSELVAWRPRSPTKPMRRTNCWR